MIPLSQVQSLPQMLARSVDSYETKSALLNPNTVGGYDAWTYAELWRDVRNVACHLADRGVEHGDRVGILAETSAWWAIADFAIMSLGAVVVPIYPSLTPVQVEYNAHQSGMKGLFVQNQKQLKKLVELPADALPELRFLVLFESTLDDKGEWLLAEAERRWQVDLFDDWRQTDAGLDDAAFRERLQSIHRDDLATIVYTSGTTGLPKGTMLTHGNLLANVEGIREIVRVEPTDRSLSYLPLSHIFERTAGQFVALEAGSTIAYSRGFDFIAEDFRRMPPTVFTTVPRLLEKVQEQVMRNVEQGGAFKRWLFRRALACGTAARVEGRPVSAAKLQFYDRVVFEKIRQATGGQLRMIISGGAPLPPYVGRFFAAVGFTVVEGYGMTETSPVVSVNPPEAPRLGTAGKVLSNVEARIAEDGELLVRGPSVMVGYYDDAAATAEAFTPDGWLHTGDIAELTPDGYLRITDRKKNLIVLSTGKKVVPAAIEVEILKDPYIDQVMLIGQGRKYVSAIVVPNEAMLKTLRTTAAGQTSAAAASESASASSAESGSLEAFLLKRIQEATAGFARFEQPKKVLIAKEPFTVENGQLTPSLKVRVKDVLKVYEQEIEALYAE
ncbi:long-chain fatty acid--CoA ligase [Alicyclobacillus cycloheptanicus]|uniref:Long-chain acyl-CoA synthetase n=1 Tax=Alicyclobacillus cycloheptanicus TaxID=1457 RepID=A0ABT9XI43_9BACL|nr:long-chain fatty acid--CoA ligase [Alicyclobacillus cycloheptanicus]MDQ0189984.1 long-chain acyl-CoA synthetase [Alicyclobacillus cycloheptanicus]WDM00105.1 long-chain fatty acid--CoA ligase [Alicyclobacillus cycloheptanicus]